MFKNFKKIFLEDFNEIMSKIPYPRGNNHDKRTKKLRYKSRRRAIKNGDFGRKSKYLRP